MGAVNFDHCSLWARLFCCSSIFLSKYSFAVVEMGAEKKPPFKGFFMGIRNLFKGFFIIFYKKFLKKCLHFLKECVKWFFYKKTLFRLVPLFGDCPLSPLGPLKGSEGTISEKGDHIFYLYPLPFRPYWTNILCPIFYKKYFKENSE